MRVAVALGLAASVAFGPLAMADPQGGGPSGTPGPAAMTSYLDGCTYHAAGVTPADGQQLGLQCNSTGQLITSGGGGGGGGGAVFGPTAKGSASGNPPIEIGGTADASATGTMEIAKVDSAGNVYVDVTNTVPVSIASSVAVTQAAASVASGAYSSGAFSSGAYASGSIAAGAEVDIGTGASPAANTVNNRLATIATNTGGQTQGSAVTGGVSRSGARAENTDPTAVTNGTAVDFAADLLGRQITVPFAPSQNWLSGAATTTANTATTLKAAQGASVLIYVTTLQCFRTDAATTLAFVTLNDNATTVEALPAGSGTNVVFTPPLVVAANTAFTFTPSASLTTVYCNFQGFKGS